MTTDDRLKQRANKVAKRPGRYNASIKKAEQQLEHTAAALAVIQQETQWVVEREKLLVDFIRCQEEVQQILLLQEQMMADIKSAPDPASAAAAHASRTVYGQVPTSSWCTSVAAKISVGHILAAQGMIAVEWCAAGCKAFMELTALLELANRDEGQGQGQGEGEGEGAGTLRQGQGQDTEGEGGACGLAHAAAAAAAAAAAVVATDSSDAVSKGILQQAAASRDSSRNSGSNAAATAAAAAAAAAAAPTLQLQGVDATLRDVFESTLCLVLAAMFYHPQPYYASAACNLSTAQVEIMPQQYLMQVVNRLQLSGVQVQHLRIANTEFVRLARLTSQEGESLAEQAAKLSLSEVLEHLQGDAHTDTAAAAADDDPDGSAPSNGHTTNHTNSSKSHRRSPLDNAAQKAARTAAEVASAAGSERSTQTQTAAAAAAGGSDGAGVGEESNDHESPGEALSRQLERYLRHMHIHTVVTAMCIANTLTPRQMAMLTVASFPFACNVHALAEACMNYNPPQPPGHDQTQQQQQQRGVPWSESWARQVDQHMQLRNAQLERQVVEWWRNNGSEQYLRM